MTKEQFARRVIEVAAFSGVVDESAAEDPEGYDAGLTVGRLRGMAEVLYSEFIAGKPDEPTRELEIPEGCWCGACGEPWTWPMSQPCPKCGNRTRLGPPAKPPAGFNCPLCGKPIEQCVSDLAREAYPGFLRPLYETVDWEPGQPISIPIPDGTYCMHEGYSGPTANCPKHGSSGNRGGEHGS